MKNKFKLFLSFLFLLHSTFSHAEIESLETRYQGIVDKIEFDNSGRLTGGLSDVIPLLNEVCPNFRFDHFPIRRILLPNEIPGQSSLLKMAALCNRPGVLRDFTQSYSHTPLTIHAIRHAFVIAAAMNHVASLNVFLDRDKVDKTALDLSPDDHANAFRATAEYNSSDAMLLLLQANHFNWAFFEKTFPQTLQCLWMKTTPPRSKFICYTSAIFSSTIFVAGVVAVFFATWKLNDLQEDV